MDSEEVLNDSVKKDSEEVLNDSVKKDSEEVLNDSVKKDSEEVLNDSVEKDSEEEEVKKILEDFYEQARQVVSHHNNVIDFRYLTSRSTEESRYHIVTLGSFLGSLCKKYAIPTEGVFLKKTELSVKVFKFLICNTNFACQILLIGDVDNGRLVNLLPPFSPYLFMEVIWYLHFDDILTESMLHFPLDLCLEVTDVIPRCLDLLDFQRAVTFLTNFIQHVYKKLVSLKDIGSQIDDSIVVPKFVGNIQELILQFTTKRIFKVLDKPAEDGYKRCGILLKKIIQMVKFCFSCKHEKFEVSSEMQNLYKLTFGDQSLQTVDATDLDKYLIEINQGLMRLLLKKVKEIDCNIFMNWMEYDDVENTSMSLQRAIGLECYFFIESTKEFMDCDNKDFIHLINCLQQLALKPDPNNSVESLYLTDLCQGVSDGKKEYLITLFKRYKEWDNNILDCINSHLFLIDKEICEVLFNHLAMELSNCQEPNDFEKLQLYTFSLAQAFMSLKITDLYEVAIKFILQFREDKKLEHDIDISNFENFIMHNSNLSNAKNLRVVLFYLCLKTMPTLKILLKMAIGHSDYPDVAISIGDVMILLPVLKIKTKTMVESWSNKCEEKREAIKPNCCGIYQSNCTTPSMRVNKLKEPKYATLAVRVLQDICLEGPKWNPNKFADLLQAMCGFCEESEIINEIITPFLLMDLCPLNYLKSILVEIVKVLDKCDCKLNINILYALNQQGLALLNSNDTSRYIVDELLTLITEIIKHFCNKIREEDNIEKYYSQLVGYKRIFLTPSLDLDTYIYLHQIKYKFNLKYPPHLNHDDTLRHTFLKCTKKQFMECLKIVICGKDVIFSWKSKADICDNVIRLALESCLLCLEYPEVSAPDSISFMSRCLIHLLPLITVTKKKTNLNSGICRSLDTHFAILKPSIEYTAISEAYNALRRKWEESKEKLAEKLTALEQFASSCSQESEKLKVFTGPHSPKALKLWLVHDTIATLLEENVTSEKHIMKLVKYFKSKNL